MNTLSQNFIIGESDKDNGNLKDSSKNNFEASFGKLILDFVKEGHSIKIESFATSEQDVEFEEELIVVDENGKEKKVIDRVKKPCYNCTALIHVLRKKINGKKICINTVQKKVTVTSDNKIAMSEVRENRNVANVPVAMSSHPDIDNSPGNDGGVE